jgi:uncharacterized protein (TIRG00374 family)
VEQELKQEQPKKNTKKIALKCVISCLLLGYLLYKTDIASIWTALKSANLVWIIIAFSLHIIGFWLTAVRWQMLLAVRGAHFPQWYLAISALIGIFFNNFLPSTVGGDVYRAYSTAKGVGSKTDSLTVIAVERLTGIFALGVFGLVALPLGFSKFGNIPIIWSALGGLLILFLLFLAAMNQAVARTIKTLFEHPELIKIPFLRKVQAKLKQIYDALCIYKRNKRVMVVSFLVGLVLQANVIVYYYFIAYSLKLQVPFAYFFLIIPVASIVLLVPVFINGIGGRELTFILLFSKFGVTASEAIAFSWIYLGMLLLQGIIGGMVYAVRRE